MFFYITTALDDGYKVGITEDIDQRQQQYTTLIPNIRFNVAVQTVHAEEIEKSFKHRFQNFRVINRTSSKNMKSEIYRVKIKYLMMHFVHCMHRYCNVVITGDNNLVFSKNQFLKNKINIYLSNYYLPVWKNNGAKFIHFGGAPISNGTWVKIKIGEIIGDSADFNEKNEVLKSEARLIYYDLDKKDFYKCINLFCDYRGKKSQYEIEEEIEKLDFKKSEEKLRGFYGISGFISPYPTAMENISRIWFKKLLEFEILRPYNLNKLLEYKMYDKNSLSLKLFGYPYSDHSDKLEYNKRENTDSLI